MGKFCCVPGCHSSTKRLKGRGAGISFFRIPKNADQRENWIRAIQRVPGPNFNITKSTTVCSLHFRPDDMWTRGGDFQQRKELKPDIVPSKFNFDVLIRPNAKKRKRPQKILRPLTPPNPEDGVEHTLVNHDYYVDPLQEAINRIEILETEVKHLKSRQFFCVEIMCDDNEKIKHFTGFTTYEKFIHLFELVEPYTKDMIYWKRRKHYMIPASSMHRQRALSPINEFFLVMVRMRKDFSDQDLAYMFNIPPSTVNSVLVSWINLLYFLLGSLPIWPSKDIVAENLPANFKDMYPNLRIIIDSAEILVETKQSHHAMLRALVGISPDEAVTLVSELHHDCGKDKDLMNRSGFLDILETGDVVMSRGLDINRELKSKGVKHVIPAPLKNTVEPELTKVTQQTKDLADTWNCIESVVGRIKLFKIFESVIPLMLSGSVSQMWVVCALLINFL